MYNHISFYGPFASRFQKPLSKDARIVPIKIHMLPRFQTPTWTHPLGRSTVLGLRPVDLTSTSNTTVICPKIRVPIEGTWRNKSTTCTQTKTDAEIFQHIPIYLGIVQLKTKIFQAQPFPLFPFRNPGLAPPTAMKEALCRFSGTGWTSNAGHLPDATISSCHWLTIFRNMHRKSWVFEESSPSLATLGHWPVNCCYPEFDFLT